MKTLPNFMILDKCRYETISANNGHLRTLGACDLVAVYDHEIDMYILIKSRQVEITNVNKMLTPFEFETFLNGYLISYREGLHADLMREKAAA